MTNFPTLPRIRVENYYARRDENGTLVETGWIDPKTGIEYPDTEMTSNKPIIDGANPAAMVPVRQEWA